MNILCVGSSESHQSLTIQIYMTFTPPTQQIFVLNVLSVQCQLASMDLMLYKLFSRQKIRLLIRNMDCCYQEHGLLLLYLEPNP